MNAILQTTDYQEKSSFPASSHCTEIQEPSETTFFKTSKSHVEAIFPSYNIERSHCGSETKFTGGFSVNSFLLSTQLPRLGSETADILFRSVIPYKIIGNARIKNIELYDEKDGLYLEAKETNPGTSRVTVNGAYWILDTTEDVSKKVTLKVTVEFGKPEAIVPKIIFSKTMLHFYNRYIFPRAHQRFCLVHTAENTESNNGKQNSYLKLYPNISNNFSSYV
ncbi:MAG: hypothetical protein HQK83_04045 [Fibrobacteria bacterium]|nr:hypothetical protein [Fibrobacteria bacterium]